MIGIIMAGGRGTRMGAGEKLLLRYKKPVILHVVQALQDSRLKGVIAVTSPHAPDTQRLLEQNDIKIIESPGAGYSQDLNLVLRKMNDTVLIVSGDMPLLDSEIIDRIIMMHDSTNTWSSVITRLDSGGVPVNFENQAFYNTGILVVNAAKISSFKKIKEEYIILDDKRVALNLNTRNDYKLLQDR